MHLPQLTEIHDRFLILSRIAHERFADALGGKLLLRGGLGPDGIGALVAVSIGGAASLCVDADGDGLREGLRAGFVDFVVSDLDEALRILKNEIRRARPVAVGLVAEADLSIDAMIERGLQPDLLSAVPERQARIFAERGALALPATAGLESELSLLSWTITEDTARSMQRIARLASESLDLARRDTPPRLRWLDRSPRYLGRTFASQQCVRMTDAETAVLLPRLHSEIPAAKIARDGDQV
ncbi:MAG TPA: hypothetical protein VGF88_07410 [Acidobacteriaceae bacterium]|jgi:hypothetical protein